MEEFVILVDKDDNEIGVKEKMAAHREALLHRAFSVFVFNDKDELLLQQRALSKYHSGGLWSNTCCSHPRPGENIIDAGHRRLMEELGFDCELEKLLHFIYRAELDQGLTEHELDHVLVGSYTGEMNPDPGEVKDVKWMKTTELKTDIVRHPDTYTEWFKIIFSNVVEALDNRS